VKVDSLQLANDIMEMVFDDLATRHAFEGALDSIDRDDYEDIERELKNKISFYLDEYLEDDNDS